MTIYPRGDRMLLDQYFLRFGQPDELEFKLNKLGSVYPITFAIADKYEAHTKWFVDGVRPPDAIRRARR